MFVVGVFDSTEGSTLVSHGRASGTAGGEITGELQGGYLWERGGPVTGLFAGVDWMRINPQGMDQMSDTHAQAGKLL